MSSPTLVQSQTSGGDRAPISPLVRLRGLFRPDRADIGAVVVFALAIGGLLLATPIAVQALVNFVAFGGATTPILFLAFLLACGLGLAALLTAFQTWIVEILQRRVFIRMVAELVRRLPRVDMARHDHRYGPELVNRFFDVVTVQKTASFLLLDGLGVVLGVIIGMLVLAFYHPILLALDLVIILAVGTIVFGLGRTGIRTAIQESKAKYAVAAWLEEVARNKVTFKEPGGEAYLVKRADAVSRDYLLSRRAHYRILFRQIIGTLALQVAASVSLLGLGGLLVVRGELTLGQLVAAELIVTYVVGSVAKMGKHLEAFYDLMGASDKLGELLDMPLENPGQERWTTARNDRGSAVEASGLSCALPSGRSLLGELDFDIAPGERVAIVADPGGGKTTLLETMLGLRRAAGGTLKLDGLDVRSVDLESLRERVAMAGEPDIFEGTIRDNVTLGRPLPAEQVHGALKAVDLLEDVLSFPDGMDTRLTAHGSPLSPGQQERLMIARAMARRPGLLLVDGLLDRLGEGESAAVLAALTSPDAPWTLVVATDRPAALPDEVRVIDLRQRQIQAEAV